MSNLANANSRAKVIRALRRFGFIERQGGPAYDMEHPDGRFTTIPRHSRINPLTLKAILKQCGIGPEDFLRQY